MVLGSSDKPTLCILLILFVSLVDAPTPTARWFHARLHVALDGHIPVEDP